MQLQSALRGKGSTVGGQCGDFTVPDEFRRVGLSVKYTGTVASVLSVQAGGAEVASLSLPVPAGGSARAVLEFDTYFDAYSLIATTATGSVEIETWVTLRK